MGENGAWPQKMGPGPIFQLLEKKGLIFYHQAWNLRK
jgi:hypothetical protein